MTSIQTTQNTTTIQMGFRRKSNDLFESVSQEFTYLYMYYHVVIVIPVENNGRTFSCLAIGVLVGC